MHADLLPARQAAWQAAATFSGAPAEFWTLLAQAAAHGTVAELAVLYVREPGPEGSEAWRPMAHWPAVDAGKLPALQAVAPAPLLTQARTAGVACGPAAGGGTRGRWNIGLLAFAADEGRHELVLAVHLGAQSLPEHEAKPYLASFLALPALYEAGRKRRGSERDAVRLAQALELVGRVLECPGFDQAALALANDLSERFGAETVSLSWRAREGLRLRAISHAEKVDRRTELSALLEEAQQEALSQGVELAWPAPGATHVLRAHERYAQLQHPGHLLTLPLLEAAGTGETHRPEAGHAGALTLERQGSAFTPSEQWALRLVCDLLLPALRMLHERSRALPVRVGAELGRSLPAWLQPNTPAGRRFAAGLAVAAVAALAVPLPTQVDGGAVVKADAMAFVGSPFDGYIESGATQLGASVQAGDLLFTLATRELTLERASILADIAQHTREAEKRRSASQLPEMLIAEAQAAQAAAKLQQVDYKLSQAAVRAPMAGVVVEGEPGKSVGGAVRRGETTVKIAALQALHVEAAVPEKDLSRIAVGAPVRVKLIALPDQAYTMKVTRIIPAAAVKDGNNTFPARIEMEGAAPAPWRPGMSGVAKIDAGWQPLAWIATHRLVDYLRLLCWW
jgi:multidrug resistance efflux pump